MKFMKIPLVVLMLAFIACQPQTESREHMDLTSNRMSDSILKLIDTSSAQPAKILAATESPTVSSTGSLTPTCSLK